MYWLMGSIGGASWYQHILTLIVLPVMIWMCLQVERLINLTEPHAQQMGVDVDKNRWKLIVAIAV